MEDNNDSEPENGEPVNEAPENRAPENRVPEPRVQRPAPAANEVLVTYEIPEGDTLYSDFGNAFARHVVPATDSRRIHHSNTQVWAPLRPIAANTLNAADPTARYVNFFITLHYRAILLLYGFNANKLKWVAGVSRSLAVPSQFEYRFKCEHNIYGLRVQLRNVHDNEDIRGLGFLMSLHVLCPRCVWIRQQLEQDREDINEDRIQNLVVQSNAQGIAMPEIKRRVRVQEQTDEQEGDDVDADQQRPQRPPRPQLGSKESEYRIRHSNKTQHVRDLCTACGSATHCQHWQHWQLTPVLFQSQCPRKTFLESGTNQTWCWVSSLPSKMRSQPCCNLSLQEQNQAQARCHKK